MVTNVSIQKTIQLTEIKEDDKACKLPIENY